MRKLTAIAVVTLSCAAGAALARGEMSLVQILANQHRLDGRVVTVAGVFELSDENGRAAIYLDEGSRKARVRVNAILLPNLERFPEQAGRIDSKKVSDLVGLYVSVRGRLEEIDYPSEFSAELVAIEFLSPYPKITPIVEE